MSDEDFEDGDPCIECGHRTRGTTDDTGEPICEDCVNFCELCDDRTSNLFRCQQCPDDHALEW